MIFVGLRVVRGAVPNDEAERERLLGRERPQVVGYARAPRLPAPRTCVAQQGAEAERRSVGTVRGSLRRG